MSATNNAIRVAFEPIRELAFGGITNVYAAVGTPFLYPCRMLVLFNNTDVLLAVSFDGVTDHLAIPGGGQIIFDFTTNRSDFGGYFVLPVGTEIWVAAPFGNPTINEFFATVIYGQD